MLVNVPFFPRDNELELEIAFPLFKDFIHGISPPPPIPLRACAVLQVVYSANINARKGRTCVLNINIHVAQAHEDESPLRQKNGLTDTQRDRQIDQLHE